MGQVSGVRILGTGSYVPTNVVTNEDLHELGCDSEWIVRRTGIRQRRCADKDQATSDLAFEAAIRCMAEANVEPGQIDLIVVATVTPDHAFPSTACHVQKRLGSLAPAMDIGAGCAGFVYAMVTASQFVATGNAKCALVVGADIMTRMADPSDQQTYPLFGDGAGAVLLTPDDDGGEILSYQMGSEGCGGATICVPAGGSRKELTPQAYEAGEQYLTMDGRNVFKWAVRVIEESAKQVLADANVRAEDVSMFVLHQANQRIIDSAVSGLNIPEEKVFVNLDKYGNTSGASIPLALDEAMLAGRIKRGDLILLSGFGAGLTWGTALIRW
jgi:3-oxoacyl-[acyl-carrier-protein] synthase-3